MDKRIVATFCAAALGFWVLMLGFGGTLPFARQSGTAANAAALAAMKSAEQESETLPAGIAAQTAAARPAAQDAQPNAPAGGVVTAPAQDAALALPCEAAILIDQTTGTVLYEKNADQKRPVASITKVMTLLLTFEAIHAGKIGYEDIVPVSEHAYSMGGSQIWLEPGEQFRLRELLKAVCVASANDAAVTIAEYVGGSEPGFVSQMNARAASLGMTNTNFCNACGLDEAGHLSTARDVAVMSRTILNECPEVLEFTGIWTDSLRGGETQLVNTNKLLRHYSGITGLKTGTTGGAGVCISASATRDGLSLIAVVLGAPSSAERFAAATTLLDYGFASYEAAAVPPLADAPLALAVKGGAQTDVLLDYSAVPERLLLQKGQGKSLSAALALPARLDAPVAAQSEVGRVSIYSGETLLGEYPVKAAQSVEKLDVGGALRLLLESLAET